MSTETQAQPLASVSPELRNKLLAKPGNAFYFQGRKIDLTTIDDATAVSLAENPQCMFLIYKDASKRPEGQIGWLHENNKEAGTKAAPQGTKTDK